MTLYLSQSINYMTPNQNNFLSHAPLFICRTLPPINSVLNKPVFSSTKMRKLIKI